METLQPWSRSSLSHTPPPPLSSLVDVVGENHYMKKNDYEEEDFSVSQNKMKPFDICTPKQIGLIVFKPSLFAKNREKRKEMKQESSKGIVELRPGMVHLKGYISLDDQIKIVKVCRELGLGEGGFYQPGYEGGTKFHFKMMCLGRNWDPQTRQYGQQRPSDGSFPPKIPYELLTLVHSAINDSHSLTKPSKSKPFPPISPDICIVKFYDQNGRLGIHQDKHESEQSIREGLPVVSFSIGDTAEFLYCDENNVDKAEKILLESGDVLIFGGKSRKVFHGVTAIKKDTAPLRLFEETNLRKPGRLSLTFRQSILPDAVRWISWHPSRENCFVLNVDGSCLGDSGRAGAGGLIRSGDGSWVIGFSCFLGIADNTYAELMALYHGLNLARHNGYTYICCYSDSKAVIELISMSSNRSHCYASVISNIQNLMNLDWEVNLSHTLREGNASADFLAKLGSNNDSRMMIWKSPPEGLNNLLLSDSRRTMHPRPYGSPPTPKSPFDICTPKQDGNTVMLKPFLFAKNRDKRKEMKQQSNKGSELRPGMVHLKGYISLNDQIKIVKVCRELGLGEGGFYQPCYEGGTKLHLKMMCLGKNWDPHTSKYGDQRPCDGSVPPKIPREFLTLVHSAIDDSLSVTKPSESKPFPSISPDICIVNYYAENGRLGLHQDKDESEKSIRDGLPVVSFSIGDTAEFLYGDENNVVKANKVLLESGDVLIFGGKSRKIFNGVASIKKDTAP